MSKTLQANLYVDEYVSSVAQARDYARRAEKCQEDIKSDIWALILATPKDVVQSDEDPISTLKARFDELWENLWDAFVDDYKYSTIADDAEFVDGSLVQLAWDEEEKERKKLQIEENERNAFFTKHKDVLNQYNFDDICLYNRMCDGKILIPDNLTKEDRDVLVSKMKEDEKREIELALKRINDNE